MGRVIFAAAGLATALLCWPVETDAQCRLCDVPTTSRESAAESDHITLEIESALAFGRLVVAGDGEGSASIHPDGSTSSSGAIASAAARAMVGSVTVRGEPGRAIRVELPRRIQLYSLDGAQIQVDEVVSDLAGSPRLDSGGRLTFRFGGRVAVHGDVDGDFRGEMPITVEYL